MKFGVRRGRFLSAEKQFSARAERRQKAASAVLTLTIYSVAHNANVQPYHITFTFVL